MATDMSRERVVHALLERQAEKYGDRTFLYFEDREYSFREVNNVANRVAKGLQLQGIAKGDKIAILTNNCPEFIFLWFGLSKLGGLEVPLNPAHKGDLLVYFLNHSDARIIVVDRRYIDRVATVLPRVPNIDIVVVLGKAVSDQPSTISWTSFQESAEALGKKVMDWGTLVENDGSYQPVDVLWSDPFTIMYTSGTTGASKGSVTPHNYAIQVAEMACETTGYSEQDCLYTPLPLFHGAAQLFCTVAALMSGASVVLAEWFSASRFWEEVKRYGCTRATLVGALVPILYMAEPKPDDADNPVRTIVVAAAPRHLFEVFEKRFGVKFIEFYGMSEISLPLMNTIKERKFGSCGKVHRDFVAKIVDDSGMEVGPNTPGEMLIRPIKPNTMQLEYYRMPEKTVEAWRDLWFHTGDCLYYDEEGFFFFVDRKKDALRRRGENISSYEVEGVISSHPAVLESAAIAVKSELGEDEVMVCLALKPGQSMDPLELIKYAEERMAYFMVPRYVRVMDALPKTPTERVEKYRLRLEGVTPETWDREKEGYRLKR